MNTLMLLGHFSCPFSQPPFHPCHCSPLGAVPKSTGFIRLILDLSQPKGTLVNNGTEFCTVRYSIFDDAVDPTRRVGNFALMVKMDVKHAFRLSC